MTAPFRFPSPVGGFAAIGFSLGSVTGLAAVEATVDPIPSWVPSLRFIHGLPAVSELAEILTIALCRKEGTCAGVNLVVPIRLSVLV